MRIVQYHPRAASGDGGITNSARRLAEALARAGAEPVMLSDADAPPPALGGVEWRSVPHRRLGPALVPLRVEDALRRADVVVLNSAWTIHNIVVAHAARRARIPYVLAPRGAYDPLILRRRRLLKALWWRLRERSLTAEAAAIHVFFESQAAHIRALGFGGRLVVAPNGVSPPDGIQWDGGSGDYLLYVGRFDPEHKGLDLLVTAIASLPSGSLPRLRMHGPDWSGGKTRLARLVRELRVDDRIEIGDAVHGEEKWRLMASARGFVYPSRWEGFGNAPAEAASLGVPTLVTPYPLGTFLAEREAAILAEATVDGLRRRLPDLVGPGAAAVGARAHNLITHTFSWDAVASSWLSQLREVQRGRSSR
jgi:glycosyltransferase involved in cell wall biosynthesis